jgi:hypothetical protein
MRLFVKNQKENEPKEAVMPDKEEAKSPFVMMKYETELKKYYFKKERYKEHQAKIFVIVKRTMNYPEYEKQSAEPKGL